MKSDITSILIDTIYSSLQFAFGLLLGQQEAILPDPLIWNVKYLKLVHSTTQKFAPISSLYPKEYTHGQWTG